MDSHALSVRKWILWLAVIAVYIAAGNTVANAASRRVAIEFAGPTNVGFNNGDGWVFNSDNCPAEAPDVVNPPATSCGLTFVNGGNAVSPEINLGFEVNIGGVRYHTIFVNKNGLVTFGSALADLAFSFQPTMADLRNFVTNNGSIVRPFISPLYANLGLPDVTLAGDFLLLADGGGVSYYRGIADPIGDPISDPFDVADAVPALAVIWKKRDASSGNGEVLATEIVIYKNGDNGDFYLDIRYGSEGADPIDISPTAVLPAVAGFSLGSSTLSFVGPLPEAPGHFFSFKNGSLDTGTPLDSDSDGVADTVDNCPLIANTDQADLDGDALGDACDADDDNDNVADTADNCPYLANTNQSNQDGDALGDACDSDDDNDGVADTVDNCPAVANPSQADYNNDGRGDACDPPPVAKRCYVDADNDVDSLDILAILKALSRNASNPTDPRDADGNGRITLADALRCTQQCTRRFCSVR